MALQRRISRAILVLGVLAAAAGCDRARTRGPSGVTTTTGADLRPDRRPTPTRTVDAAGFVDNAGRSSNENVRTELSGMRASETGTESPTGTPGSGLPLPIEPAVPAEASGERPRPPELGRNTPAGAPAEAVPGRLAQAACDHENACGRVGKDKPSPSIAACVNHVRQSVREDLSRTGCPDGYDPNELADCLSAIRLGPCDRQLSDAVGALPECDARALCVRR